MRLDEGRRGGLSAHPCQDFSVVVEGPMLLGQNAPIGGGLVEADGCRMAPVDQGT